MPRKYPAPPPKAVRAVPKPLKTLVKGRQLDPGLKAKTTADKPAALKGEALSFQDARKDLVAQELRLENKRHPGLSKAARFKALKRLLEEQPRLRKSQTTQSA